MKDGKYLVIGLAIIFVLVLAVLYLSFPETRNMSYTVSYQDPVYRTESYQDSVYRTEYYQDPVYRTESYQDPVYRTIYYGVIGEYHLIGGNTEYNVDGATSMEWTYTGSGNWGSEYTVKVCWNNDCKYYYKVQYDNTHIRKDITSYETKSRQVIDHYETKNNQVFDRYEIKNRQVVDHYETKYKTEYKDVTKMRIEWILSQ